MISALVQRKSSMRALVLLLALAALNSVAQTYPNRPVRMIVPFAPGGTTDGLGRVLAVSLGERLGQQVVVENRPGGGGTIGAEAGARATPDGYTILLGSAEAFGMTDAMRKRLGYNPEKDLVPVTMMARSPSVTASTRPRPSVVPPGANGTIMRTARLG